MSEPKDPIEIASEIMAGVLAVIIGSAVAVGIIAAIGYVVYRMVWFS